MSDRDDITQEEAAAIADSVAGPGTGDGIGDIITRLGLDGEPDADGDGEEES
jgi:hypothetical protein